MPILLQLPQQLQLSYMSLWCPYGHFLILVK